MIQGVVNRLSLNSFLLKGWSVVLVSAMFALAAKDNQLFFVYLNIFSNHNPSGALMDTFSIKKGCSARFMIEFESYQRIK